MPGLPQRIPSRLLLLGVQVFLEDDSEFLAEGLELVEVLLVLALVLNLGLDSCGAKVCELGCVRLLSSHRMMLQGSVEVLTLEDPHSSGEVVDSPGGLERGGDHGRRRDEIVGEGVVQVALQGQG